MDISVVIVSYNVRPFLEKCLLSIFKSVNDLDVEVFVVDNASVDDSVSFVRTNFPSVHLIANEQNLGFARANNVAIKRAKGRYILILNPDTVINEETLSTCFTFMENREDAGAIGVKMLDGTGTYLPESKRGLPSPKNSFFKITGLNRLFSRSNFFNGYYMGGLDPEHTNPVPVLTGAFMFCRGDLLKEIGGFDEDYFMYGEDIDLCFRILKAGYENFYVPESSIIHYKGESTKRSSLEYVRTFYNAMLIFVGKHYSGTRGLVLKQFLRLGILLRAGISGMRRFLGKIMIPLLDIATMILALFAVRWFWASWYFGDPGHFDDNFYRINLPVYIALWLLGLLLFGCYDGRRKGLNILGGIGLGTILVLILYALLPEELRSSRAVILLAVPVIVVALMIEAFIRNRIFNARRRKTIAVVAKRAEAERIMELINRIEPTASLAGAIAPVDSSADGFFISDQSALDTVVREYGINELIFSSSDIGFNAINRWMSHFGSSLTYKIASDKSDEIVGSDSKTQAARLSASNIAFAIDHPWRRRNKRVLDVLVAIVILVASPILVLFGRGRRRIERAWVVLLGKFTWVAYDERDGRLAELPQIKQGLLSPAAGLREIGENPRELHTLNYLYAREYTLWKDLEIILGSSSG